MAKLIATLDAGCAGDRALKCAGGGCNRKPSPTSAAREDVQALLTRATVTPIRAGIIHAAQHVPAISGDESMTGDAVRQVMAHRRRQRLHFRPAAWTT